MSDLARHVVLGCRYCDVTFEGVYPEVDQRWLVHAAQRHSTMPWLPPLGRDGFDLVPDLPAELAGPYWSDRSQRWARESVSARSRIRAWLQRAGWR